VVALSATTLRDRLGVPPFVRRRAHWPSARAVDLSSTTLRGWLDVSPVSTVNAIGHPLARTLSAVVDDGQRIQVIRAWFNPELSKIVADEVLPQTASINPAL
jgi:hypothetical protein